MRQFYTRYPYSLIFKALVLLIITLIIANIGSGSIGFGGALLFILALAPTSFLLIDLLVLPGLGIRAATAIYWIWALLIGLLYRNLGYLDVGWFQLLILVTGLTVIEYYFHRMLKNASKL